MDIDIEQLLNCCREIGATEQRIRELTTQLAQSQARLTELGAEFSKLQSTVGKHEPVHTPSLNRAPIPHLEAILKPPAKISQNSKLHDTPQTSPHRPKRGTSMDRRLRKNTNTYEKRYISYNYISFGEQLDIGTPDTFYHSKTNRARVCIWLTRDESEAIYELIRERQMRTPQETQRRTNTTPTKHKGNQD